MILTTISFFLKVRCEADLRDFFYNESRPAFAETRIISQKLSLSFVGDPPWVFRPEMSLEGRVSIRHNDHVSLNEEVNHFSSTCVIFFVTVTFNCF